MSSWRTTSKQIVNIDITVGFLQYEAAHNKASYCKNLALSNDVFILLINGSLTVLVVPLPTHLISDALQISSFNLLYNYFSIEIQRTLEHTMAVLYLYIELYS